MKKQSLRLAVLLVVLGVTTWLSANPKAQAATLPSCSNKQGRACNPANWAPARCWWETAGEPTVCLCDSATATWQCIGLT